MYVDVHVVPFIFFLNLNRNVPTNYSTNFKYANARKFVELMSRCSMQTDGQADVRKTAVDNGLARVPTLVHHT